MATKEEPNPPPQWISIDIETTGPAIPVNGSDQPHDEVFAIGWSYGPAPEDARCGQLPSNIKSGQLVRQVLYHEPENWEAEWKENQWSPKTGQWWLGKNKEVLKMLQDPSVINCDSEEDMMRQFSNVLRMVFKEAKNNLVYLFDTTTFDSVWIGALLAKWGLPPLSVIVSNTKEDDIFIPTVMTGSYMKGLANHFSTDKAHAKQLIQEMRAHGIDGLCNDHMPKNDALNIFMEFFAAVQWAKSRVMIRVDNPTKDECDRWWRLTSPQRNLGFDPNGGGIPIPVGEHGPTTGDIIKTPEGHILFHRRLFIDDVAAALLSVATANPTIDDDTVLHLARFVELMDQRAMKRHGYEKSTKRARAVQVDPLDVQVLKVRKHNKDVSN